MSFLGGFNLLDDAGGGLYEAGSHKLDQLYQKLTGNPDAIKAAYDKAIAASQANSARNVNFLMGNKGSALAKYAPMQAMFDRTYGSGIAPPQAPGVPQGASLNAMYGKR